MKLHKSIYAFLFVVFPLFMFGCAPKVDLSKHLITLNYRYFQDSSTPEDKIIRFYPADSSFAKLGAANYQVKNKLPTGPLPAFIAENPLISKTIQAAYQSLREPQITSMEVTKDDILSVNTLIAENFGAGGSKQGNKNENEENGFLDKLRAYFFAYYTDDVNGFVDRYGTTYKLPAKMEGIGNEVITANFVLFLEAVFDDLMDDMPVFVDQHGKIKTKTGKIPTVSKYARSEPIVPDGQPGITEDELKIIWLLEGLGGNQSKALSGAVYRLFGDLELGCVFVGGHFSIGDNDTLARILDTIFEVLTRRLVECASYWGLKKKTTLVKGKIPATPAEKLLADLARLEKK